MKERSKGQTSKARSKGEKTTKAICETPTKQSRRRMEETKQAENITSTK